jgi:hypothetical protein
VGDIWEKREREGVKREESFFLDMLYEYGYG